MAKILFLPQCQLAMFCMFLLTVNFGVSTPISPSIFLLGKFQFYIGQILISTKSRGNIFKKCMTSVFTCSVKKVIVLNSSSLYIFISCLNVGTAYGSLDNPKLTFSNSVKLRVGNNKISLLSVAVGLSVSCPFSNVMLYVTFSIC